MSTFSAEARIRSLRESISSLEAELQRCQNQERAITTCRAKSDEGRLQDEYDGLSAQQRGLKSRISQLNKLINDANSTPVEGSRVQTKTLQKSQTQSRPRPAQPDGELADVHRRRLEAEMEMYTAYKLLADQADKQRRVNRLSDTLEKERATRVNLEETMRQTQEMSAQHNGQGPQERRLRRQIDLAHKTGRVARVRQRELSAQEQQLKTECESIQKEIDELSVGSPEELDAQLTDASRQMDEASAQLREARSRQAHCDDLDQQAAEQTLANNAVVILAAKGRITALGAENAILRQRIEQLCTITHESVDDYL